MLFSGLCEAFSRIEKTRSGNEMRTILAAFLKKTPADEVGIVCNLMEGQLASPYEGTVTGVAEKMAVRAIASAIARAAGGRCSSGNGESFSSASSAPGSPVPLGGVTFGAFSVVGKASTLPGR